MRAIAMTGMLLVAGAAFAQPAPPPPNAGPKIPPPAPRARGPQLDVAVDMAKIAVATCLANGYKVTALVTDSAGVAVAMLSGDGAAERTQFIAPTKVAMVLRYKEPSGVTTARSKTDAALAAELAADPKIGTPRQGGVPLIVGGETIGVFAVSGAPGGDKDEACVRAAIDQVGARLR